VGEWVMCWEKPTQVRIVVVLVKRTPEEGSDHTGALDGAEGEMHGPDHVLVGLVRQRQVARREGLGLLCV
jgi:hypothetical protein